MLSELVNMIKQKQIVIWGVGAIQTDVEALFDLKVACYIDEALDQKRERIAPLQHPLKKPDEVKMEDKDLLFFIICEQEYGEIQQKLNDMGFAEHRHYVSYERLLYEYDFQELLDRIENQTQALWGLGKTFKDYNRYINENFRRISFYIDEQMASGLKSLDGKDVLAFEAARDRLQDVFLIITSAYYPQIDIKLRSLGKKPGVDYISIYTLQILIDHQTRLTKKYSFIDRRKNSDNLLLVLAGYKERLWEDIFRRIKAYTPSHYDVCIMSSGLYDIRLSEICQQNGWSYLSTGSNKISVIINTAIHIHAAAKFIFKMDEDIFITRGIFEKLLNTYKVFEKKERYQIGFVSPLIPVNTYGYVRVLEKLHLEAEWEARFGKLKYTDGLTHHYEIAQNYHAAMFMWGDGNRILKDIDSLSHELGGQPLQYSICPNRYSIGMILFTRETWIDMGLFPVTAGSNLGADEEHICCYCMMNGKAMVVAENAVAGHLGYGAQTEKMMDYFENNIEGAHINVGTT